MNRNILAALCLTAGVAIGAAASPLAAQTAASPTERWDNVCVEETRRLRGAEYFERTLNQMNRGGYQLVSDTQGPQGYHTLCFKRRVR